MRHLTLLAVSFVVTLMSAKAAAQGKAQITIAKFADETTMSHCKETPGARLGADTAIREQLIAQLMGLRRFQIQEREIRPLKPQHSITGTVTKFEVCQNGRGQEVHVEILVKMTSKNGVTRTFTSQAMASNSAMNIAPTQAIRSAVGEVVRRIDDLFPRHRQVRLPIKRVRRVMAENDIQIKLYRKKR